MIWKSETRRLDELKPAKYNPRKLSAKQKADLNDSIEKFSLVDPLVINSNGTIIGGHQRYSLLRERGVVEVDVRVPECELDEVAERELNLRLNKNTGEFDLDLLAAFDPRMLVNVGFDGDFVDNIMALATREDDIDVQKAYDAIDKPVTQHGDVYEFPGGHRLMCGSSVEAVDVEKLMAGAKADLVYTDPPYNVDYKSSGGHGYSDGKFKSDKVFNDNLKDPDFVEFLQRVFKNAFDFSHDHVNVYCWFAMTNYPLFRTAIESVGFRYMQVLTWLKDRFILSRGWYYHRITEPCMIFYKDWNKKFVNVYYAKNHDMWQVDRLTFDESLEIIYQRRDDTKDYQHLTQKPVRLAERALKRNSEVGQIVLDLFGGGGSTLLCCHQLQRKCYAMELDPKYVDVIVKRFEKMFDLKVNLLKSKTDEPDK